MHFIEDKELSLVLYISKGELDITCQQLTIRRTCGFLNEDFSYSDLLSNSRDIGYFCE
jgi:hypothetical protein